MEEGRPFLRHSSEPSRAAQTPSRRMRATAAGAWGRGKRVRRESGDYFAARAETIFPAVSCPTPSISASSWTEASRRPSTE